MVAPWSPLPVTTVVVVCTVTVAGTVRSESAVVEPNLFDAFTWTRSSWAVSVVRTPYVFPFAPAMSTQLFPFTSHCCHWYENVLTPVQVPLLAVSVLPTTGTPEMLGRAVFFGVPRAATTPLP